MAEEPKNTGCIPLEPPSLPSLSRCTLDPSPPPIPFDAPAALEDEAESENEAFLGALSANLQPA